MSAIYKRKIIIFYCLLLAVLIVTTAETLNIYNPQLVKIFPVGNDPRTKLLLQAEAFGSYDLEALYDEIDNGACNGSKWS